MVKNRVFFLENEEINIESSRNQHRYYFVTPGWVLFCYTWLLAASSIDADLVRSCSYYCEFVIAKAVMLVSSLN
jgi:hypothetical protein